MSLKKIHSKEPLARLDSKVEPSSPFLDEEMFSDAELVESENIYLRIDASQLDSPFLNVFENPVLDSDESETQEIEDYLYDEDEELGQDDIIYGEENFVNALAEEAEFLEENGSEYFDGYQDVDDELKEDEIYLEELDIEDGLDEEADEYPDEDEYEGFSDYQNDEGVDDELEENFEYLNEQCLDRGGEEGSIEKFDESIEAIIEDEFNEYKSDGESSFNDYGTDLELEGNDNDFDDMDDEFEEVDYEEDHLTYNFENEEYQKDFYDGWNHEIEKETAQNVNSLIHNIVETAKAEFRRWNYGKLKETV